MPVDCPHCSQPIEKLTGFVSQETLTSRLKAKSDENAALAAELKNAQTKAAAHDTVAEQLAKATAEIEGIRTRETRLGALTSAGLKPELLEHVGLLYESARAGEEGLDFGAWLGEEGAARQHPLLAPHFGAGAAAAAAAAAPPAGQQGASAGPVRTAGSIGQAPGAPAKAPSVADLQATFASDEFRALPREQQRAKMAELRAQVSAPKSGA